MAMCYQKLGILEGAALGDCVGNVLGNWLGPADGDALGERDGSFEGEALGKCINVAFMFEADFLIVHPQEGWFLPAGSA